MYKIKRHHETNLLKRTEGENLCLHFIAPLRVRGGDWPPRQGFASEPLLKSIRFEKSSDHAEKIFFELNGFYPPEVFGFKGDQPRVVCDFKKVNLEKSLTKVLETNGTFILRIRVEIYPPTK